MLDNFMAQYRGIGNGSGLDSLQIAVPLPSKRGPFLPAHPRHDFSNIIYNSPPVEKPQKQLKKDSLSYPAAPFPLQNLKTVMEEVQKSDNEIFIGDLTKTQKELLNLRNMENRVIASELSKIFQHDEQDLVSSLLINGSYETILGQNKLEFNPFLNYREMCRYQQVKLSKNLSLLKEKCLYVNLLENPIKAKDKKVNVSELLQESCESDDVKPLKERKFVKNVPSENVCNWSCPFKDCDKAYSGRASLRMHIKHKHTYGDSIKKDYPYSLSSIFTPNFGRGVDINKVVKKRTKIGSAATNDNEEENMPPIGEVSED
jgi:hypothetical protein